MSTNSMLDIVKLKLLDASDFFSWKIQVQLGMKERECFYNVQHEIVGKCEEQAAQSLQAVNFVSRPIKPSQKLPAHKGDTPTHWGHWAADCRVPKKQKEEVPHNVVNMMVDNSDHKSFVAMIGSSLHGASSEWWLDSGVTCHVTNDRGLLTEIRAVHDRFENYNAGETTVTHAGTLNLVQSSEKLATCVEEEPLLSTK